MDYIKEFESYQSEQPSAITLGKFDGLHRGHQKLIHKICEYKKEYGVTSIVFAFNMIPFFEKQGIVRRGIMTNEERRERLENTVDVLVECPFDEKVSHIPAEDFIEKVLVGIFHAKYIVVGTDFHFGYQKRGDVHMLAEYAEKYGYELTIVEKEMYGEREISSTYIKEELLKGNIEAVNEMLGYSYMIHGTVEYGKQLGRKLGFPTMNVHPSDEKLLPPKGVYMDSILIDGTWYHGIGNIGVKPTVTEEKRMLVETYLFEYNGNAYGKNVRIELHRFKRPEQKFASVDEMKEQVGHDISYAKEYFKNFLTQ